MFEYISQFFISTFQPLCQNFEDGTNSSITESNFKTMAVVATAVTKMKKLRKNN
jgi:hypothetical protein